MKAGVACAALQAPWRLRWQRSRQRVARWSPSCRTGTREGSTRTDSRAAPATLRLHLDVSILRQAQDRYVAKDALASTTEATDNVAWSLLKNQAFTSSMNTWPPLAGCLLTGRRRGDRHWLTSPSRTATISATVLGTALAAFAPRLATPAQSYGLTHARYFLPIRLDGAHEAIRAYFALYRSEDQTVCCLPTSTRPANVLAFVPAMGNQGWQATCTNVAIDGPTI
jgi:hypothetical protein